MKNIDKAMQVREGEEQDWAALEAYLRTVLPETTYGNMQVLQFHGGHANLTYLLRLGEKELVIRRPPFGKIAPGAHDMKREFRVLSKLHQFFPQAPQAYHYCDDESIIGAPFVVLERKTGVVVRTHVLDCFKSYDNAAERLAEALVKVSANLHKVDFEKADLAKLGRPEGFLERQLAGLEKRWSLVKAGNSNDMDYVIEHLTANIPTPQAISIIHNDLKLDNCQFQPDNPDEVTAVFDWDMTTLGDPLVDLGTTLSYWREPYFDKHDLPVYLSTEFPTKQFVIDKYAEYTGFSMENINWYHAFAFLRIGVIAAQLYQRYVNGKSTDQRMKKFQNAADIFAGYARKLMTE